MSAQLTLSSTSTGKRQTWCHILISISQCKIPAVWCARLKTTLIISEEWSGKRKHSWGIAHKLNNLNSPQASLGQTAMRVDPDAEGFWGEAGAPGAPQQLSQWELGFIWRFQAGLVWNAAPADTGHGKRRQSPFMFRPHPNRPRLSVPGSRGYFGESPQSPPNLFLSQWTSW